MEGGEGTEGVGGLAAVFGVVLAVFDGAGAHGSFGAQLGMGSELVGEGFVGGGIEFLTFGEGGVVERQPLVAGRGVGLGEESFDLGALEDVGRGGCAEQGQ